MRNFKRFLSMILTVLMVAGCLSVFASASYYGYEDLEGSDDYAYEIGALNAIGVMQGKTADTFGYKDGVTRRQMAILVARVMAARVDKDYEEMNFKGSENITPYKDLDAQGDYYGAISLVSGLGIVKGTSATTFDPNSGIMYRDALTMIVRALGYDTKEMGEGYPWSYVFKADELGVTQGLTRVIGISEKLTRAEVAKLIYNTLFNVWTADGKKLMNNFGSFEVYTVTPVKDQTSAAKGKTLVQKVEVDNAVSGFTKSVKFVGSAYAVDSSILDGAVFGDFVQFLDVTNRDPLTGKNVTKTTCFGKLQPKVYSRQNNEFKFVKNNGVYTLSLGGVDYTIVNSIDPTSNDTQLLVGSILNGCDYKNGNDSDDYYFTLCKTGISPLDKWLTSNDTHLHSEITAYDFDLDGKADFVVFNRYNIGRALIQDVDSGNGVMVNCARFVIGTANFNFWANTPVSADNPTIDGDNKTSAFIKTSDIVNNTESAVVNNSIVIWKYDGVTGKVTVNNVIEQGTVTGTLTGYSLTTKEVYIDGQKYPLFTYGIYGAEEFRPHKIFGKDMKVAASKDNKTIISQNLDSFLSKKVTASLFKGRIVYMENVTEATVDPVKLEPNYLFDKVVRQSVSTKDGVTKVDSIDMLVLGTDGQYAVVTVKTINGAAIPVGSDGKADVAALLTRGGFINVTGTNAIADINKLSVKLQAYGSGAFLQFTKLNGAWSSTEHIPNVRTQATAIPSRIIVANDYGYNVLDLSTAKDYAQFYTEGSTACKFGDAVLILGGTSVARHAVRGMESVNNVRDVWNQSVDNGGIYAVVMFDGSIGGDSKIVANLDGAAVDTYNYYYDNKALDYDVSKGGIQKTGFYGYMFWQNNSAFGNIYSDFDLEAGKNYTLIKVNGNIFVGREVTNIMDYITIGGDFANPPMLNAIG